MLPDWLRGGMGGRLRSGGDHNERVGRGLETVPLPPLKAYVTASPSLALAAGRRALSDLPTTPYPCLRPIPHGNWTKTVGRCFLTVSPGSGIVGPHLA